ncbi:aberrant root formation protein 4 isoform X2 [Triticum aestivum]|uniref:Aberrant root formation protein n=1 Tax=Triticum aestivum TaxID=4565 RepID=A0A3B6SE38_WHEAT|nr:aberrant root formation protein 4-like isoform X2 [Triticum aestivum]
MARDEPSAAAVDVADGDSPSSSPTLTRLREALAALSKAFESGDTASSDAAAALVAEILSPSDADASAALSEQMLREVHAFLSRPSSNQMAIDALSLELPKPVAKLGARMGNCRDIARTIIEFFVSNCSPRDMLCILCEALDTPVALNGSAYLVILLDGLASTLILIQRRHIEQVKVVLPAILRVMHANLSECDGEHGMSAVDLFSAALRIGNAIQEMCKTMVNHRKEELCSILGLYALQNIALVSSESKHQNIQSTCGSVVLQYSKLLMFCGFTYLGLLTGNDVTSATTKLSKEEDDNFLDCFSFAMDGASLVVVWTSMHDDMSKYAGAEFESALKEVQDNCIRKWEAINMFRYVLSSVNYSWAIKSHSLDLLLTLVDDKCSEETNDHVDFPCSTQIFAILKAIERVMIAAPDTLMRKKAFSALKRVISVVPSTQRFDILQALIENSMFPSLTAILLDLVKNEVLRESRRADQVNGSDRSQDSGESPPWASQVLELVELILRPPEGGPPCLRDHSEEVLSALNLLRLILIIDSRGSRSAKMLRDEKIRAVYSEWLLPLRSVVTGNQSELEKDGGDDDENQMACLLNPVQLVLHRCIELVEEKMKGL